MSKGIAVAGVGVGGVLSNQLNTPYSLALDFANTMYIADFINNRVQQWTVDDIQGTTVAGQANGTSGAGSNALFRPIGVIIDENDNIYAADAVNNRVQFWANEASTGTTIAGTGNLMRKKLLLKKHLCVCKPWLIVFLFMISNINYKSLS
jgi:hypothetical protein